MKCRQCLPKVFQQEGLPSDGETQSKVLFAVPCVDALNLLREPGKVPCDSVVEARRSGCPGGHASVPQGLIGDRKASDLAPARRSWVTGAADGVRRSGYPGGHASASQGLVSDRKARDLAPSLSSATGSVDCGLHVMVRQARDRKFEYLNARQEALEDENGGEYWSNPRRGHDLNEVLDLVPMRCDVRANTIDTLMEINITGSADLQKASDCYVANTSTFSHPRSKKNRLAWVPSLSMKVALDKWKDKRNRLSPRFLTRDKDADLRNKSHC